MDSTPYPPLQAIEQRLFDPSLELIAGWAENRISPALGTALGASPRARELLDRYQTMAAEEAASGVEPLSAELVAAQPPVADTPPRWLTALWERKMRTMRAFSGRVTPRSGRILEFRQQVMGPRGGLDIHLASPLAVLLVEEIETPGVWWGWMVAPELDYAGPWDVVLDETLDGPLDPLAELVQLHTPLYVQVSGATGVLGEVSPARLAAMRALSRVMVAAPRPFSDPPLMEGNDLPAWPGVLARREVSVGGGIHHTLWTGGCLGGEDDPRHRYAELYHAAAEALQEGALASMAQGGWVERVWESLRGTLGAFVERTSGPELGMAWALGAERDAPEPSHAQFVLAQWLYLEVQEREGGGCRFVFKLAPEAAGEVELSIPGIVNKPRRLHHGGPLFAVSLEGGVGYTLHLKFIPGEEYDIPLPLDPSSWLVPLGEGMGGDGEG